MKQVIRLAALAACIAAASATWAEDPGVTDKEIVVGAISPFKGPAGPLGYASILGMNIAIGEINDAGGVNGRKLRMVAEDDDYVPARTVQALQKLMDVDKVFAMTAASGAAHLLAVLPTMEENGIPSINPIVASMQSFTPIRRTHFGVGMSYREGAYDLMKAMAARYPNLKWASIVQDDESGIDQEVGYLKAVADLKLNSVLELRHKRGQTDFSAEVLRMNAAGATGVYLGTLPTATAAVLKEARRLGMSPKYGAIWTSHLPQVFGVFSDAADGLVVYDFVPAIEGDAAKSVREMAKKYLSASDQEKLNRYTLTGYATMKVMADAMRRCGRDITRKCVVAQIEATRNFETGVMSAITFGPTVHLTKTNGHLLRLDYANKRFVPLN